MEQILIELHTYFTTTDCGKVLTKIAAIGSMVWMLWLVFSYVARQQRTPAQPIRRDDDNDNFPPDAAGLGI